MSLAAKEKGRLLLSLHVCRMLTGEQSMCAVQDGPFSKTHRQTLMLLMNKLSPPHCLLLPCLFPQR